MRLHQVSRKDWLTFGEQQAAIKNRERFSRIGGAMHDEPGFR
jgi:hypothetical protein